MLKTQFGETATANFQEGTWTFKIKDDMEISTGAFAIIPEEKYQKIINLLERAKGLVGNPGTNISVSTDIACDIWQSDYEDWHS